MNHLLQYTETYSGPLHTGISYNLWESKIFLEQKIDRRGFIVVIFITTTSLKMQINVIFGMLIVQSV